MANGGPVGDVVVVVVVNAIAMVVVRNFGGRGDGSGFYRGCDCGCVGSVVCCGFCCGCGGSCPLGTPL